VIDPAWKRRRQSRRRPAGKPGTPAASGLEASPAKPAPPADKPGTPAASPGRSFGRVAAAYELGRPSWPAEAVDHVIQELELDGDETVLDLGAGTGKLTRVLLPRFARVVAVEPEEAMRALIPGGAETQAGTAEEIPLEDEAVAAVFCGESFHWFEWPRAIPEIMRVLRSRGGLALMWNRPSGGLSSDTWPQGVRDALDRLVDPSPPHRRYRGFAWRDALAGSPFGGLRREVYPNDEEIGSETLLARVASWSQVASLPDREREAFLAEISSFLTAPSYTVRLETHLYWTRLAS
jgi:SAM-dependent methyltransferase